MNVVKTGTGGMAVSAMVHPPHTSGCDKIQGGPPWRAPRRRHPEWWEAQNHAAMGGNPKRVRRWRGCLGLTLHDVETTSPALPPPLDPSLRWGDKTGLRSFDLPQILKFLLPCCARGTGSPVAAGDDSRGGCCRFQSRADREICPARGVLPPALDKAANTGKSR